MNYGQHKHYWIPRHLLTVVEDTEDLTYLIKPEIHFGGYLSTPGGSLYNAFVLLDALVQAKNGTQLVSQIAGTGPGTPSGSPVYHPHTAISTGLWLNTSIKDEPNSLHIRPDGGRITASINCAINDLDTLPELEIPASDKLRMWFWQLDRLMSDHRLNLPSTILPQIEAGSS